MDIGKKGLLAIFAIIVLLCSGCRTDENQVIETQSVNINEVMSSHTIVEIVDAPNTPSLSGEAKVQITMPDINKIYMDLLQKGKANTMTLEEIGSAVAEYAVNKDFQLTCNTTALVEKNGEEWALSSDESVSALIEQQINDLLVQLINNIGVIEIEGDCE